MTDRLTASRLRALAREVEAGELSRAELAEVARLLLAHARAFTEAPVLHGRVSEVTFTQPRPPTISYIDGGRSAPPLMPERSTVDLELRHATMRRWPSGSFSAAFGADGRCVDLLLVRPLPFTLREEGEGEEE